MNAAYKKFHLNITRVIPLVLVTLIVNAGACIAQNCEKFFFTSPQTTNVISNIWMMDTDGTNRHVLFNDMYYRQALNVSRDGSMLSYSKRKSPGTGTSGDSLWICTSNPDGSNEQVHYLVPNYPTYGVLSTSISSDKSKIAFSTFYDGWPVTTPGRDGNLFILDLPGGAVTQLTFNTDTPKFELDFSPDSSKIIYSQLGTTWYAFPYFLQRMNSDGSGKIQYLPLGTGAYQACKYSPNSAKIVFAFETVFGGPFTLHTINANGTGLHSLGYATTVNMQPAYNPGSNKIVLWDATNNLRILDTNGTALLTIPSTTNTRFYDINWVSLGYTPDITVTPAHPSICNGQNVVLTASGGVTYSWSPGTGLSGATGTVVTANPFTTIAYTITGTDTNGCKGIAIDTITVHALPVVTVTPSLTTICSGTSATLTAGGALSYTWTPAVTLSSSTGISVAASPVGATLYTVTGTDTFGCSRQATARINVNATPSAPAVSSPVIYCVNDPSIPLTAVGAGLLWYATASGGVGSGTPPVPSTSVADTTTYYVSQTAGGCESARDSVKVIVKPLPLITVSTATVAICYGAGTVITAGGGVSYMWVPAAGLSTVTGAIVTASPAVTTTYSVTGTGSNGCSNTATVSVVVHALPVITTTPSPAGMCSGDSVVLTAAGAMSYIWSPATALSATTGSAVTATPASTATYTITGTDMNGCIATTTLTVSVGTAPLPPVVSTPVIYCRYDPAVPLTATGTGLLWYTLATGGTGGIAAPVPSTAVADTSTYYVSQTVSGCESRRDSIKVIVKPLPAVSVTPDAAAFCAGGSTILTASGAISYIWTPPAGLNTVTGATVTASPAISATYTVTGTWSNGCHNTAPAVITVRPLPVVVINPNPATICMGQSTTLIAAGANTYVWTPAATLSSATGASVTASPQDTVAYMVTGTDVYGCVGYATAIVNVNPIPLPPLVLSPVSYCQGTIALPLTATGTNLLWYTTMSGGSGSSIAPVPSTMVIDTITWYVSQAVNGCESARDSIDVIINHNSETGFEYMIKYGCVQDTVLFTNTSLYTMKYLWSFDDGAKDTTTSPVHYFPAVPGDADRAVMLYGSSSSCLDDTTMQAITLKPSPPLVLINVTLNQTISYGSSIQLNADGADFYLWTPDNGTLSAPDINNPVATPAEAITYIVYGRTLEGCTDSATVHIDLSYPAGEVIPSAFTPNGDGVNDVFRVLNTGYSKLVDLKVYNRWGQLVFQSSEITKGWDGTFNGVPQDLGTYQYMAIVAHPDGSVKHYKGDVTLIR